MSNDPFAVLSDDNVQNKDQKHDITNSSVGTNSDMDILNDNQSNKENIKLSNEQGIPKEM